MINLFDKPIAQSSMDVIYFAQSFLFSSRLKLSFNIKA